MRGRHKIAPNGYNIGRDLIVKKATRGSRYRGRTWTTTVEYVEGLLEPGDTGAFDDPLLALAREKLLNSLALRMLVSLYSVSLLTADINHGIKQDGRVAVLTAIEF